MATQCFDKAVVKVNGTEVPCEKVCMTTYFICSGNENKCKCGASGKIKIRGKYYCHNCARKKLEGW